MGREDRIRKRKIDSISGGDIAGFGVGRKTARRRKLEERANDIVLGADQVKGMNAEQISQLLVLMRSVRDEFRRGLRKRELVEFGIDDAGNVVVADDV